LPLTIPHEKPSIEPEQQNNQLLIPEYQRFDTSHATYRTDIREVAGDTNFSLTTQTTVNSSSIYLINTNKAWQYVKDTCNRLTNEFRIKENKYGFGSVQSEILAAKYAGLTGIQAPFTLFAHGAEKDNPGLIAKLPEEQKTDPVYFVASQRLKGYTDLSTFIDAVHNNALSSERTLFNHILPEGNPENRKLFFENYEKLKKLRELPDTNTAENKIKKRDCMLNCFKLMPQEIQDIVDESYAVSAWIGNWDMFNWNLENMGFTVSPIQQRSATGGGIELFRLA